MAIALALSAFLALQDAKELVERLRSESLDERTAACEKLKALGKAALSELERATSDRDADVAGRARQLVRAINLRSKLSARLLAAMPGVDDRLAGDDAHAWTEALHEAVAKDRSDARRHPELTKDDVDVLAAAALRAATDAERAATCTIVAEWRLSSATPEVVKLLDGNLRGQAARTLARLGAKDAAPQIVPLLQDKRVSVRWEAARALADLGAKSALPAIMPLLDDENDMLRQGATYAIEHLDARDRIPDLLRVMREGPPGAGSGMTAALVRMRAVEAVPELVKMLKHERPNARCTAADALGRLGAAEAVPDLVKALADDDDNVRFASARAVGLLRAKEAVPALKELVRAGAAPSGKDRVRAAAARALALCGASDAIPAIAKLLEDEAGFVRMTAAHALALLRAKETAPAVARLLSDKEAYVRGGAALALASLAPERVDAILPLLKDEDATARSRVALALGRTGDAPSVVKLTPLLADESSDVRTAAAGALGEIGDASAIPALEKLLDDQDWSVGFTAGGAVCACGSRKGVPALLRARYNMVWLNSVVAPKPWKRLGEKAFDGNPGDSGRRILERVAAAAGMTLEMPEGFREHERRALYEDWWHVLRGERATLRDAFVAVMRTAPGFEAVLEADRIRILPRDDAHALWAEWWEKESRK